jgi:hypothetical protein
MADHQAIDRGDIACDFTVCWYPSSRPRSLLEQDQQAGGVVWDR